MAKREIEGARVVLTGASSGIGHATALELGRQGAQLIVNARRRERLESLCRDLRRTGRVAHLVAGDLTDDSVRRAIIDIAEREFGELDLLINNAGIGALGPFSEANEDRLRHVMEVNFFAPIELIRAAIPYLRRGHQQMIVNVGSVLGHRAVPKKSEYCASKFALHGFSDALRAELASDGVDVLLVSPSTTASEFFDNVVADATSSTPNATRGMSPQTVARKTINAIRRGRHEVILSAGGKLLVWADRFCPPLMNRIIARFG